MQLYAAHYNSCFHDLSRQNEENIKLKLDWKMMCRVLWRVLLWEIWGTASLSLSQNLLRFSSYFKTSSQVFLRCFQRYTKALTSPWHIFPWDIIWLRFFLHCSLVHSPAHISYFIIYCNLKKKTHETIRIFQQRKNSKKFSYQNLKMQSANPTFNSQSWLRFDVFWFKHNFFF